VSRAVRASLPKLTARNRTAIAPVTAANIATPPGGRREVRRPRLHHDKLRVRTPTERPLIGTSGCMHA
jgi:hypothetical protein